MKLYLGIFFLVIALFSCKYQGIGSKNQKTPQNKIQAVIKYDAVRLRKEPNTKSDVIITLKNGESVDILRKTDQKTKLADYPEDYWYEVNSSANITGWVYGSLIEISITTSSEANRNIGGDKKSVESNEYKWKISDIRKMNSPLLSAGNLLIFCSTDNDIDAYDGQTGRKKWNVSSKVKITEVLLLNDENLLFYDLNRISCIKTGDGSVRWSIKPSKFVSTNFVFDKKYIYYADSGMEIRILDVNNGKTVDSFKINEPVRYIQIAGTGIMAYNGKDAIFPLNIPVHKEK